MFIKVISDSAGNEFNINIDHIVMVKPIDGKTCTLVLDQGTKSDMQVFESFYSIDDKIRRATFRS